MIRECTFTAKKILIRRVQFFSKSTTNFKRSRFFETPVFTGSSFESQVTSFTGASIPPSPDAFRLARFKGETLIVDPDSPLAAETARGILSPHTVVIDPPPSGHEGVS